MFANSQIECTEGISTSNLATDEEVILSHIGSALPNSGTPGGKSFNGNLSCLVDTDGIKIESLESETRKVDEPVHDAWLPFSKTILHGGKLAELTLPIGVNTEGFKIPILIEIRGVASVRGHVNFDNAAIVAIERGEYARLVERIADLNQFYRQ